MQKPGAQRAKQHPRTQVDIAIQAAPGYNTNDAPQQQIATTVVNITNSNGSITPVTLRRSGNLWIGPKGEQYLSIPTPEQLKPIYGL